MVRSKKILLVLMLILTGCTSLPTSLNSAPVPEDRLLSKQKKDEKNSAEVVVIRDRSLSGSICYYAIYVDDVLAARIGASEKAVFSLEPGVRRLKVTRDPQGEGLCSSGDDMTEQQVTLVSSDKKYFRLSMKLSGWPDLQAIEPPVEKL